MKKLTGYKPLNLDEISDKRDIFSGIKDIQNKINHLFLGLASPEVFRSSRSYVPKKSFGKIEFLEFLEKFYSDGIFLRLG